MKSIIFPGHHAPREGQPALQLVMDLASLELSPDSNDNDILVALLRALHSVLPDDKIEQVNRETGFGDKCDIEVHLHDNCLTLHTSNETIIQLRCEIHSALRDYLRQHQIKMSSNVDLAEADFNDDTEYDVFSIDIFIYNADGNRDKIVEQKLKDDITAQVIHPLLEKYGLKPAYRVPPLAPIELPAL